MRVARLASSTSLEAENIQNPNNCNSVTELALLNNAITLGDFEAAQDVPMELTKQERLDYSNECRNQSRRSATLDTHPSQAYSLILGQCTQLLQDKMKQDASWTTMSMSCDPLELYKLIERVILKQNEDQYPFAAIHKQNLAVLNTKQGGLSNTQWYERFNTRYDVARSVGVEFGHKVLWEYCTQLAHSRSYDSLGMNVQATIRQAAEGRYLTYLLLVNSCAQHELLRKEFQNNFMKGSNKYPENCPQTLLFLDRYSKSIPMDGGSQGTAFTQKGGKPKMGEAKKATDNKKSKKKDFDNEYFKDKPCFKCGKKGHPQSHRPSKDDNDDNSSISSKSSRNSNSARKPKIKDFENQFKSLTKSFAQLKSAQENNSYSNSSEEMSHFQYASKINGGGGLPKEFMDMIFKQSKKGLCGFDLREVVLLDNQSTVDLFCNKKHIKNICLAPEPLTLKSNGGELLIHHIADGNEYDEPVWFSKHVIANIFALKIMKKQYTVTYDSV